MSLFTILKRIIDRFSVEYIVEYKKTAEYKYKKWASGDAEIWYTNHIKSRIKGY